MCEMPDGDSRGTNAGRLIREKENGKARQGRLCCGEGNNIQEPDLLYSTLPAAAVPFQAAGRRWTLEVVLPLLRIRVLSRAVCECASVRARDGHVGCAPMLVQARTGVQVMRVPTTTRWTGRRGGSRARARSRTAVHCQPHPGRGCCVHGECLSSSNLVPTYRKVVSILRTLGQLSPFLDITESVNSNNKAKAVSLCSDGQSMIIRSNVSPASVNRVCWPCCGPSANRRIMIELPANLECPGAHRQLQLTVRSTAHAEARKSSPWFSSFRSFQTPESTEPGRRNLRNQRSPRGTRPAMAQFPRIESATWLSTAGRKAGAVECDAGLPFPAFWLLVPTRRSPTPSRQAMSPSFRPAATTREAGVLRLSKSPCL